MIKEYGWQCIGERLAASKPGSRGKRVSVLGARTKECSDLIAPFYFECYTNKEVFKTWLEKVLLPNISEGKKCIIMDNASFHKGDYIEEIIEDKGHKILYLPAYSPDLNPIEKKWAQIKRLFRKYSYFFEDKRKLLDLLLVNNNVAIS